MTKRIEDYTLREIYNGLERRIARDYLEGKNPDLGGIRWTANNAGLELDQRVEFVCGLTGVVVEQSPDKTVSIIEISCREFREVWNATSFDDQFNLTHAEWKARQGQK